MGANLFFSLLITSHYILHFTSFHFQELQTTSNYFKHALARPPGQQWLRESREQGAESKMKADGRWIDCKRQLPTNAAPMASTFQTLVKNHMKLYMAYGELNMTNNGKPPNRQLTEQSPEVP